jgi:acetate kinase
MANETDSLILTINSGSSSLKFALFEMAEGERCLRSGLIERVGLDHGLLHVRDETGAALAEEPVAVPDHQAALEVLLAWLRKERGGQIAHAVGHRVVHGGPHHTRPEFVTPALLAELKDLIPLAPDHLPQEIAAIEAVARRHPGTPQVACFDTAFHRTMPRVAQLYGLPQQLSAGGVIRYGFHGLSYEYLVEELRRANQAEAEGRVVIAHLGNGASMAAVRGGRSVEVTMGFTPTSGLVMSTRCGDLDPSVVLYLIEERGLTPAAVRNVLNCEAGLLGVSGETSDMQDLLRREGRDARAAEAVELFCYQARKHLGALAAALGGLDALVFSGGIGENARPVRARICEGLAHLGIVIDAARNEASAPIISRDDSPVTVRVIKTNEERMIARHASRAIRERSA